MKFKVNKKNLSRKLLELAADHSVLSLILSLVSLLVKFTGFSFEMGFCEISLSFSTFGIKRVLFGVIGAFLMTSIAELIAYFVVRHLIRKEERS